MSQTALVRKALSSSANIVSLASTIQRMVDLPSDTFTMNTPAIKDCLNDSVRVLRLIAADLNVSIEDAVTEMEAQLDGQS